MGRLKKNAFHPFLLGIYIVLGLLAQNVAQIEAKVILNPLFVILGGTFLLFLFWYLVLRSWIKAGILTTIVGLLFFSYGHVYSTLKAINVSDVFLFRHRTMLPLWGIFFILAVVLIIRTRELSALNFYLNVVFIFLVGTSIVQTLFLFVNSVDVTPNNLTQTFGESTGSTEPDLYYIILDGYGRHDMLIELMEYDNSAFISGLEEMGFYIADCSQSNYAQTQLSLGSSLNFNYLDTLAAEGGVNATEKINTSSLIKHSAMRDFLEARGYVTVAFATGFNFTQITDADIYLAPKPGRHLNEFEYLLLQTTIIRAFIDFQAGDVDDATSSIYRERTLFTLDKLDTLYHDPRPKFIFAHIVIPHQPFVLGPLGEPIVTGSTRDDKFTLEDYITGYTGQLAYVNGVIRDVLRTIIAESDRPVLILLQGDHGPGRFTPEVRMKILNAYYFFDQNYANLYEAISPVNSFRVILSTYFEQELPLLEDVSRYSEYNRPYDYQIIENTCDR